MKTGKDLVDFALKLKGRPYVFGILVPKDDKNYKGGFDCAEFCSYTIFQVSGILVGVSGTNPKTADAYTGFFGDQLQRGLKLKKISISEASITPGAMLLRLPKGSAIGHIVFCQGDGKKTIEAHSTKMGTIESVITGRNWDYGILVEGIDYSKTKSTIQVKEPKIVYKLTDPMMKAKGVEMIQKALMNEGFYARKIDQWFGKGTHDAVVAFQLKNGLVADGQITPDGETAKELGISYCI